MCGGEKERKRRWRCLCADGDLGSVLFSQEYLELPGDLGERFLGLLGGAEASEAGVSRAQLLGLVLRVCRDGKDGKERLVFGMFASQDEGVLDREGALAMFRRLRDLGFLTIEAKDPGAENIDAKETTATAGSSAGERVPQQQQILQEVLLVRVRDKMFEYAEYLGGAKQACNFAEFKAWKDRSGMRRSGLERQIKRLTFLFSSISQPQGFFRDLRRGCMTSFWESWKMHSPKSSLGRHFLWLVVSHS